MRVSSIAALNAYLAEFYRPAIERARAGLPYAAPTPQRTTDAAQPVAPVPVAEAACIGTFRHAGSVVVRIHEKGTQRG